MRRHNVTNETEYLVARAQAETYIARHILEEAQKANDYWKEKAAAKMLAFYENEEKMLTLYAEMKLYHPELSAELEDQKPYLLDLLAQAKSRWDAQHNA